MTNREKYPNTDDAMKAWRKHKDESGCTCSFETWLDSDFDSEVRKAGILTGIVGVALLSDLLSKSKDTDAKPSEPTADKPKDDKLGDVECPLCHGKHGYFNTRLFTAFHCPDCRADICNVDIVRRAPFGDPDDFKAWFSKFTAKKD